MDEWLLAGATQRVTFPISQNNSIPGNFHRSTKVVDALSGVAIGSERFQALGEVRLRGGD